LRDWDAKPLILVVNIGKKH